LLLVVLADTVIHPMVMIAMSMISLPVVRSQD
jgi:hypothetical protein